MCDSRVIERCCGTCRRWEPDQERPWKGKCRLDGKERNIGDMSGCLGWKLAEPWELEKRGLKEVI